MSIKYTGIALTLTLLITACSSFKHPVTLSNEAYERGDLSLSEEILLNSVKENDLRSMRELGFLYITDSPLQDENKGYFWLERLATLDSYKNAEAIVSYLYSNHPTTERRNYWLYYAARWNDTSAIIIMLEKGLDIPLPDLFNQHEMIEAMAASARDERIRKAVNQQIDGNIKVFKDLIKK